MQSMSVECTCVGRCDWRLYERALAAAELPYWQTEGDGDLMPGTFGTTLRKMAYSAQMYHYESQKRRIIEEELRFVHRSFRSK